MNSFANSLFALMFGWARDLIQRLWEGAASGSYSKTLAWLGDHWLWLALGLCLICTAVDFGVWMVRWQPYLVWRSMLRKADRLLHGEKVDNPRKFARGYQGGVELKGQQWAEDALRVTLNVIGGFPMTARFLVPESFAFKSLSVPDGVTAATRLEAGGKVLAVTLSADSTRDVPLALSFK